MSNEENIVKELTGKFNYLEGKIAVQRQRRIFAEVSLEHFKEVFEFAVNNAGFSMLSAITGLDEGANLGFIYHLGKESGIMLNLKTSAPKENPLIDSVTKYFPSADIYEREMVDLLGAKVHGLGPGPRYPLTDDWPKEEYPLRKDWKPKDS